MSVTSSDAGVLEDPFVSLCSAALGFFTAFSPLAPLIAFQNKVDAAVRSAKATENAGTKIFRHNAISDFGIDRTRIGEKVVPVEVKLDRVLSASDLWHFRCPSQTARPLNTIVMPHSGGRKILLKPVIEALLPHMDVAVVAWPDPHNLNKNIVFDLDTQIDCISESCVRLGKIGRGRVDVLSGISQGGVAAALAIGAMGAAPGKYQEFMPGKVILEVAPINTRLDRSRKNWMLKYKPLDHGIIIPIGQDYEGEGRAILPYEVMRVLYDSKANKLRGDTEGQAQSASFVRDMYERIYQQNQLAEGKFRHRDAKIDLGAFKGKLMTVTAEGDDLVSPEETAFAHHLFSGVSPADRISVHLKQGGTGESGSVGHYDVLQDCPAFRAKIAQTVSFVLGTPRPN